MQTVDNLSGVAGRFSADVSVCRVELWSRVADVTDMDSFTCSVPALNSKTGVSAYIYSTNNVVE